MRNDRLKLSGAEQDAFSRRSRRLLVWKRGELRGIKRRFARRSRRSVRIATAKELA
jgi:hypothetical protein